MGKRWRRFKQRVAGKVVGRAVEREVENIVREGEKKGLPMKGFKTVAFGAALMLLGGLESAQMTSFLTENAGAYSAFVGVAVIALRAMTNSSIFNAD